MNNSEFYKNPENKKSCTVEEVLNCISILDAILANPAILAELSEAQRVSLIKSAGLLSRPDKDEAKRRIKEKRELEKSAAIAKERSARASTGIRLAREASVFKAPEKILNTSEEHEVGELNSPRNCYVCKKEFTRLHFFYDAMCPECADSNYQKRYQSASLEGQVAVITGSRLKIGYHSTLMMLRAGATVIATTRFPVDSALRFSKEPDFIQWQERLHIYGLDLRHTPSVDLFAKHLEQNLGRLDILINNAAQTVRRPPGFYAHLMHNETMDYAHLPKEVQNLLTRYQECLDHIELPSGVSNVVQGALPVSWQGKIPGMGLCSSAVLSQLPYEYDDSLQVEKVFPKGQLDADLQQVDLRETNSWRLILGEIPISEMFELQLVNAIAPFVLCNRLAPLMKKDFTGQKHIVNVSAMEGKFLRFKKSERHPHTNMAKAALNMLTRTSAGELAKHGIFMNAVDTGWVTDEDPVQLARFKQEVHDFQPPLDIVDGAARVCDPFFHGILTGTHWSGKFLKDYFPIDW